MSNIKIMEQNPEYYSNTERRWTTYNIYKMFIWAWMLNDVAISIAVAVISHSGFYIHFALYIFAVIFIGIPLVYSEICLAQYTNKGIISLWNFFPIFRPVGYGAVYLAVIKYIYLMTLTSWYLQYTFYAALDPPPWYTCDDFNSTSCMVKRINVSVYQHCLEAQLLFDDDCGIKTASNCFFEREIGDKNSLTSLFCAFSWKSIVASGTISCLLFVLSLRKMKFVQMFVKCLAMYICFVILVLLSVALSTSGAWYATEITIDWSKYGFENCFNSILSGFISLGTGYGVIGFLTKDVSFRSPANMTAISTSLLALFITIMYTLIIFSGIKTMSYYHGEEENVIETGVSSFFQEFASISEILSYFDQTPMWGFIWFSSIFLCLLLNLWILHYYLKSVIIDKVSFARKHGSISSIVMTFILTLLSWPVFCSDITGAFLNAIHIIQIISSLLFSIALYWFYGHNKHNVDIIFMIGIKATCFWKVVWILNPILIFCILYTKFASLETQPFDDILMIGDINHDILIVYIIVGVYGILIVSNMIIQIIFYLYNNSIRDAFLPTEDWGPKDYILFKSRKMFVPEIMTREFLYRQVRIHGYSNKNKIVKKRRSEQCEVDETSSQVTEWSAFTSN